MLARMNFASTLSLNQKVRLGTAAAGARDSAQSLLNFMLAKMTPADANGMFADLLGYAGTGTWTGSDTQLQTKASGLAHLILGSAEYQFV